jgi:hypothetical protein
VVEGQFKVKKEINRMDRISRIKERQMYKGKRQK